MGTTTTTGSCRGSPGTSPETLPGTIPTTGDVAPAAAVTRWAPGEVKMRRVPRDYPLPPGAWLCVPRNLRFKGAITMAPDPGYIPVYDNAVHGGRLRVHSAHSLFQTSHNPMFDRTEHVHTTVQPPLKSSVNE